MDRRKAMKISAGIIAGGGIGALTLSTAFKPLENPVPEPERLDYSFSEEKWKYEWLNPDLSARLAYHHYNEGSCMFTTIKSIVVQLAEKFGEPYKSFPLHIFKYGHGGIGGYGSVCGALNGAAALIGMVIPEKDTRDKLISDIFRWYEQEPFPQFIPDNPADDNVSIKSISGSVLCHVSNTNWCNKAGMDINSNERKEKCRRLTADVAKKVTESLNYLVSNEYVANTLVNTEANACISCHGDNGKMKNVSGKMSCTSCHSETVGHKVFSDIHYKIMPE